MASNKPNDANCASGSNVRVKTEPGTSTALKNIKTEPGLSTYTTRLTSFRIPRDLTLGGSIKTEKSKKVYTPNFNVERNKKKNDEVTSKSNSKATKDRDRGRGRGRGQGTKRDKMANNFTQSVGVFSESFGTTKRYSGSRNFNDEKNPRAFIEKPKLQLDRNIDKTEEEEKLKLLLRDDFIDDGTELDTYNAPIMLPMVDGGKLYKEDRKIEPEIIDETKQEDVKPIICENGEVKFDEKKTKKSIPQICSEEKRLPITIPQIIDKSNNYILIQFPDCLPGLRIDDESNEPRSSRTSMETNTENENETKSKVEYCTLGSLREGMLGKLQILKSGKTRLVLGNNNLVVDVGSSPSFRQDLIAAKIDTEQSTGHLINLGSVRNTLICSPDWESMLAKL